MPVQIQICLKSLFIKFMKIFIAGLTPLLCAVKNHGVIEEESQCLVNNKPTIRTLLKAGADPKVPVRLDNRFHRLGYPDGFLFRF